MEPITFMAIAAFVGYRASGVVLDRATSDAYDLLMDKVKGKFGDRSGVTDAVSRFEDKPESEARKGVVREELDEAKADEDPDIEAAAKKLLDLMDDQPGSKQYVQTVRGDNNALAQDNSSASVSINRPEDRTPE